MNTLPWQTPFITVASWKLRSASQTVLRCWPTTLTAKLSTTPLISTATTAWLENSTLRGGPAMAAAPVPDILREVIEPLLPLPRPKPQGGRPRIADRVCLKGIVFVLRSGIPWEMLPKELGCGSGMTCWRRLRDWQRAGVWRRLHRALLQPLQDAGRIDWTRGAISWSTVTACRWR